MPTRLSVPAPRPLSPRAAAYVRQVFEATAARQQAIEKAVLAAGAPTTRPVAKATTKTKADQVAVYDQGGNLIGICDPSDVTPIASAEPKAPPAAQPPPAAPAQTQAAAEPAQVTKARAQTLSANLKKSLNGGTGASTAEVNRVADAMNQAAILKYRELRQRGLFPGAPRRP